VRKRAGERLLLAHPAFPLGVIDDGEDAAGHLEEYWEEEARGGEPGAYADSPACESTATVRDYERALDALFLAGAAQVRMMSVRPDPWTAGQSPVPAASLGGVLWPEVADRVHAYLPVRLPYARKPPEPVDDDDWDVMAVARDGAVSWKLEPVTLGRLRERLSEARVLWERKLERAGTAKSRPVLWLRVDRELPWGRFRWLLRIVDDAGPFRIRLMARDELDRSWSVEAARVLAPRGGGRGRLPLPPGFGEFLLPFPEAAGAGEPDFSVTLHEPADGEGVLYQVFDYKPLPHLQGRDHMLEDFAGKETVALRVQDWVPLWAVVETIGELGARGFRVLRRGEDGAVSERVLARDRLPVEPPE